MAARKQLHKVYKSMLDNIVYQQFRISTQPTIAIRMEAEELLDHFIDKWNPAMNNKPITYFHGNIKDKLQRYVNDNANPVRITEQYAFKIGKYKNAVDELTQSLERHPTDIEIHRQLKKVHPTYEWNLRDVTRLKKEIRTTTLATSTIGRQDDSGFLVGDVAFSEGSDDPMQDYLFQVKLRETMAKVDGLTEPTKTILLHTFGLNGYAKLSLRELATKLGINKYRVQTCLDEAKAALTNPPGVPFNGKC